MTKRTILQPHGILQFPIDTLEAAWIELTAIDPVGEVAGYVAYALMVGTRAETPSGDPLDTAKGRIEVPTLGTEYWFTPTADAVTLTSEHSLQVAFERVPDVTTAGWSKIIEAVDASSGLVSSTGSLSPVFVGPVGAVSWSDDEDDLREVVGLQTFAFSVDDIEWGLSFRQTSGTSALEMLYLTHDDAALSNTALPNLPASIPHTSGHQPARIYVGYDPQS